MSRNVIYGVILLQIIESIFGKNTLAAAIKCIYISTKFSIHNFISLRKIKNMSNRYTNFLIEDIFADTDVLAKDDKYQVKYFL